jgi:hypothetical protein
MKRLVLAAAFLVAAAVAVADDRVLVPDLGGYVEQDAGENAAAPDRSGSPPPAQLPIAREPTPCMFGPVTRRITWDEIWAIMGATPTRREAWRAILARPDDPEAEPLSFGINAVDDGLGDGLVCPQEPVVEEGDWPPNLAAARDHFFQHREQFEELIDQLEQDGFDAVTLGSPGLPVGIVDDACPTVPCTSVDVARMQAWAGLLRAVGVITMSENSGVQYHFRLPPELVDEMVWKRSLVRWNGHVDPPAISSCATVKRSKCGFCAAPLVDRWELHYGWRPKDGGPGACSQAPSQ